MPKDDFNLFDDYPDMDFDGDNDIQDYALYEEFLDEVMDEEEKQKKLKFGSDDLDYNDIDGDDDSDDEDDSDVEDNGILFNDSQYDDCDDEYDEEDEDEEDEEDEEYDDCDIDDDHIIKIGLDIKWPEFKPPEELTPLEEAKNQLQWLIENPDSYDEKSAKELKEKCEFIINHHDDILAAKYYSLSRNFDLGRAVVENFELPQELIDDYDIENSDIYSIIVDIADVDQDLSIDVWYWAIKNFLQYGKYDEYLDDSLRTISLYDLPDGYDKKLLEAFEKHPDFCEAIIGNPNDYQMPFADLILLAFQLGKIELAQRMFTLFMNTNVLMKNKAIFIDGMLERGSNYDESDTMKAIKTYLIPILQKNDNVTLQRKLPGFIKRIDDYIENMAESDSDQEQDEEFGGINDSPEQTVDSNLINDDTVYEYCKVRLDDFSNIVFYSTGDYSVGLGDRVVVPYGADNKERIGTVIAVGECYPSALPFSISKLKTIKVVF